MDVPNSGKRAGEKDAGSEFVNEDYASRCERGRKQGVCRKVSDYRRYHKYGERKEKRCVGFG